jgi:hypothetical protein
MLDRPARRTLSAGAVRARLSRWRRRNGLTTGPGSSIAGGRQHDARSTTRRVAKTSNRPGRSRLGDLREWPQPFRCATRAQRLLYLEHNHPIGGVTFKPVAIDPSVVVEIKRWGDA